MRYCTACGRELRRHEEHECDECTREVGDYPDPPEDHYDRED